jgi:hypothetical protein
VNIRLNGEIGLGATPCMNVTTNVYILMRQNTVNQKSGNCYQTFLNDLMIHFVDFLCVCTGFESGSETGSETNL